MSSTNVLLLRQPSEKLAEGQVSHIADERNAVSPECSLQQWREYAQVFAGLGWQLQYVPPTDAPDGVFIEDQLVFFSHPLVGKDRGLIMQCSPGSAPRKPEVEGSAAAGQKFATKFGLAFDRLSSPATLDGGDILKLEDRKIVFVGVSARTNESGRQALKALLEPRGYRVIPVPVTKALHLKSAVTALPDGTIIGYDPIVDDEAKHVFAESGLAYQAVPEEHGVAVVVVGPKDVLMSADAPRTKKLWESRGLNVYTADIGDFEKLEGWYVLNSWRETLTCAVVLTARIMPCSVTCLSVRLRQMLV